MRTTVEYAPSLHDVMPISCSHWPRAEMSAGAGNPLAPVHTVGDADMASKAGSSSTRRISVSTTASKLIGSVNWPQKEPNFYVKFVTGFPKMAFGKFWWIQRNPWKESIELCQRRSPRKYQSTCLMCNCSCDERRRWLQEFIHSAIARICNPQDNGYLFCKQGRKCFCREQLRRQ